MLSSNCYPSAMRSIPLVAVIALLLCAIGCHSAYIDAVVQNRTHDPISLLEVDYPSASFGTQTLMPGADFHYRFKVLGHGPTKVLWTDNTHKERSSAGPDLHESDEGNLVITFAGSQPTWQKSLRDRGQPR